MNSAFNINYEWLSGDYGNEAESLTTADLMISAGPWRATEVEDLLAKTVRPSARLSALRLAEWFAGNWWRLVWEPRNDSHSWRASHGMNNVGYGYVWPNLSFSSDWQSIHIRSRPTTRWEAEPIRYLTHFDFSVSIGDFVDSIDDFIDGTIARLFHVQNGASQLGMLWDEIREERRDPDIAELRMLEACMGYDPDEVPDYHIEGLRKLMGIHGRSAVQEMAAAHGLATVPNLKNLWDTAHEDNVVVCVPDCDDVRRRIGEECDDLQAPWQRAESAASIVREKWDLRSPVSTETFCDILGIRQPDFLHDKPGGQGSFMAGFREAGATDSFLASINSRYGTSRRFELARLVADHLSAGEEDVLLPGTRSMTSRQKFQRAFAQEFLCPFPELEEYLGTDYPNSDDIYDAAQHFDVSPLLIHTTLVNKGVLRRETLEGSMEWIPSHV